MTTHKRLHFSPYYVIWSAFQVEEASSVKEVGFFILIFKVVYKLGYWNVFEFVILKLYASFNDHYCHKTRDT